MNQSLQRRLKSVPRRREATRYLLVGLIWNYREAIQGQRIWTSAECRRTCVPEKCRGMCFWKLEITSMPSQPTMSRLCQKRSHAYDECFVNPSRKRKSEGMHPEIWKGPPHLGQWNACPKSDVSSKTIKGMGIRIFDRVNEMLPDEKINHSTFF